MQPNPTHLYSEANLLEVCGSCCQISIYRIATNVTQTQLSRLCSKLKYNGGITRGICAGAKLWSTMLEEACLPQCCKSVDMQHIYTLYTFCIHFVYKIKISQINSSQPSKTIQQNNILSCWIGPSGSILSGSILRRETFPSAILSCHGSISWRSNNRKAKTMSLALPTIAVF